MQPFAKMARTRATACPSLPNTLGVGYTEGPWQLNVDSSFQSNPYADNKGKYVGEPRTVYVQTSIAF